MTTTLPRPIDAAAFAPRPSWRAIALLTALVLALHLLALGLMPARLGTDALPLESRFITRTIVIAPPPPAVETPAPPPAAVPAPAPVRVARPPPPKRPRAVTPPAAPAPQPTPPVMTAETSRDTAPAAPAAEASAPQASEGAPAAPAMPAPPSTGGSDPLNAQLSAGATQPLVVPGSVRLAFDVTGQRRISVQTVGPRDADVWVFNVEGEEQVHVPAGDFMARKLTRSPRREFDHKLELWLASDIGYLPVRIRQTEADGDVIDMQLRDKAAPPAAN
ncbi:MAG: DUF3108 domain-containing protein [Variovorax sp.]|nr:MAG: DUF3108 domain-containing protein [Variovorax sp.]